MSVDQEEANENVSKRLEFIEAEIAKLDAAIGKSPPLRLFALTSYLQYCQSRSP
jgi:chaperonin cofactor prefoldin